LYGKSGLIGSNVPDPVIKSYTPRLTWVTNFLGLFNITETMAFFIIIAIYLLSLVLIVLNYKKFLFSIMAWLIQLIIISSSFLFSTGGDSLITFLLFLNMLVCTDGVIKEKAVYAAVYSFAIRMLQIQLCIIYFFSGFGKILGFDWFDGNAVWFITNTYTSAFARRSLSLFGIHGFGYLLKVSGWIVVFMELFFPILISIRFSRLLTFSVIILMHLFISSIMGLISFGMIMIIFNVVAWGGYFYSPGFLLFKKNKLSSVTS
jgi:hypothetical protein